MEQVLFIPHSILDRISLPTLSEIRVPRQKLYSNVLCDHAGSSFGEQGNFTWKMEMKMSSIFSPVSIDAVNCGSVLMQVPHMM